MKKSVIILACMLVCNLFPGCTYDKDKDNSGADSGNSVEIDIDTDAKDDTDISSGDGGIIYDFKNPENPDDIVITPRE